MSFFSYRPSWQRGTRKYEVKTSFEADPSIEEKIKKVLSENNRLSLREKEICESMLSYWERNGKKITSKQYKYFLVIEKRYSSENEETEKAFLEAWSNNPEHKEDWNICCKHYSEGRYYSSIIEKNRDLDYTPNSIEFDKICRNKYSERLLKSHRDPAKFEVGELVEHVSKHKNVFANSKEVFLVLQPDCEIPINAVKGAKRYKVYNVATGKQDIFEERQFKKVKSEKTKKES
ncbi:MAG: hypothetical protein Q8P81_03280 [Nanoarchaeota archaeon]|nr:hypothetical protein [Nanoarchaeota archaeon]